MLSKIVNRCEGFRIMVSCVILMSLYEFVMSGTVHLLGGCFYMMNLIIVSIDFMFGYEVLICEIKLY